MKDEYKIKEGWEKCTNKEVAEQLIRFETNLIMSQKALSESKTKFDEKLKEIL